MSLLRFLGLGSDAGGSDAGRSDPSGDTATVRRIAGQLERLEAEQARYLAAFAYVLARVAHADLRLEDAEVEAMERAVSGLASLSEAEIALVVQIAHSQARLLGGTENYVVTREFRRISSREQRNELLDCLFAVAAADGTISGIESAEIASIGEELGFTRPEINAVRSRWRDRLSELQPR